MKLPFPANGGAMLFRRLPLLLLAISLCALPGIAQNNPRERSVFSIGGSVRDNNDHHGFEGIEVVLKGATGSPITSVFTRDEGDFQFDGLRNGDYQVEIKLQDYETAQEHVSISGASRMGLSIFLNRVGKPANLGTQYSISAHQLSVPHKAHDEFEKGMALIYTKSDYRGAIVQFQLAIKDFPTYYEAFAEEGSAYYQLQDMSHAEEALQKSVDLSAGQYADALFTLSSIMNDTKRYAEAETISRRGILADASSFRGPFELARALIAQKRTEEAEKSAQKSRDLMPDNSAVYLLLANIHIQRKDYPALVRDLDDYLRLTPLGPEADQARKTRERVQAMMNAPKDDAEEDDSDPDDPQKGAADAPSGANGAATSRRLEPDTSGLPSLPPPTQGNP